MLSKSDHTTLYIVCGVCWFLCLCFSFNGTLCNYTGTIFIRVRHKMAFTENVASASTEWVPRHSNHFNNGIENDLEITYLNHNRQSQSALINFQFASFAASTARLCVFAFIWKLLCHRHWSQTRTFTYRMFNSTNQMTIKNFLLFFVSTLR